MSWFPFVVVLLLMATLAHSVTLTPFYMYKTNLRSTAPLFVNPLCPALCHDPGGKIVDHVMVPDYQNEGPLPEEVATVELHVRFCTPHEYTHSLINPHPPSTAIV